MFLTRKYPRGVMTRSRLDWQLDRAMTGQVEVNTGNSNFPTVSLYNDATDGTVLGVVALLAWSSLTPALVWANMLLGTSGIPTGTPQAYVVGSPSTSGVTYADANVFAQPGFPPNFKFIADGRSWLTMDRAPLAVIRPGWRLSLFSGVAINGDIDRPGAMTATFVWVPF